MSQKILAIGNDHAGVAYKDAIVEHLIQNSYLVENFGTDSADSVDYPNFAHAVANNVELGISDFGILICGSGNGVCMTANKHQAVRAALCWSAELATLARAHNDANILCIPARFVDLDVAIAMVDAFLETNFEGGRHQNRVDKISCQ